jgi:hypothetical protein
VMTASAKKSLGGIGRVFPRCKCQMALMPGRLAPSISQRGLFPHHAACRVLHQGGRAWRRSGASGVLAEFAFDEDGLKYRSRPKRSSGPLGARSRS